MRRLNLTVPSLFALTVLVGCASGIQIAARQPYMGEKIDRPDRIIVHDFAAAPGDILPESALAGRFAGHPAPQTPEQIETGRTLAAQVAQNLVTEIQDMGLPAVYAAGQPAPQIGDLVIRGYFVSINQDCLGEHMLIGLSSKTADLRTLVEGHLEMDQGLFRLGTGQLEPGGSKTPGMPMGFISLAATGSPLDLIVNGASRLEGERKGPATLVDAAQATAKEIAYQLKGKFREQGWI
ncbi:DUF4410 domain-containing protein [Methylobacter sp. YRD-M1]|uniref:DUF4410 domain-containing protein n=1 Tax=Methylobacter sp. YRD-M1 TaxID=2911520 RepID=UPI00227C1D5C|nr:DUF4410 domain-containing protein [Methylobacter sp. YRD-M1]WAK03858.1 DUF4410 domain-containing protein [Methylobacter sp. YRD-M1]